MQPSLSLLAGRDALVRLRRHGLDLASVKIVAGAAGGAKWLALSQLDRLLFGELLAHRAQPLYLLGSSIGSWRFAAVSQQDPLAAIERFEDAYIAQCYAARPSAREVADTSRGILEAVIPDRGAAEVLSHPSHRLSLIAARSRAAVASDWQPALLFGVAGAALLNAVSAQSMGLFFRRTLFSDPRSVPPFRGAAGFAADHVALTPHNLRDALLASGSIPLVMAGVAGIAGAPAGVYRDGGVLDYHLNVPFLQRDAEELVLFPHFGEKVIPGWFDRSLPWRRAHAERMANVLLVAPSPAFVASLPFGKIPDRQDFYLFKGRDRERMAYWRQVIAACARLADDFNELVVKDRIGEVVRPLP